MTWYLGYVYGGKSMAVDKNEDGEVVVSRQFHQFIVEAELRALGIECWCGHKIDFKRVGKRRRPEPHERPYLLNYIFADIPAELFFKAIQIKHLAPTLMALTAKDLNGVPKHDGPGGVTVPAVPGLRQFRAAVDDEYAAACRVKASQTLVPEYLPGQALRYIDGGFGDRLMRFKGLVERAGALHPKISAEMEFMGRAVTVEVDPLSVRAAE